MYDIIICGAGAAGCSFARHTASNGLKVLLLEKNPRVKLGHDWWDTVKQEVFEDTLTPPPVPPERLKYSASIYTSPDGTTRMQVTTGKKYSVDRKLFAKRLLAMAIEAGADFQDNTKVLRPKVSGDKAVSYTHLRAHETRHDLVCRLLLEKKKYFGHHKGVSWISFRQKGLVDILAGTLNLPNHTNPKDIVKEYLQDYKGDIGDKIIRAGYEGIIPVRRCFDSFIANNFLIMGDSACQNNPIDGSGVAASMYAGCYAALPVINAFKQDKPLDKKTLWSYNHTYKSKIGPKFVALDIIRLFLIGRDQQERDLNYLFKRRIIEATDFQKSNQKVSFFKSLKKLIRGLDRIFLLKKLKKTIHLSKEAAALYRDFPPEYKPSEFSNWQKKLRAIYEEIPTEI